VDAYRLLESELPASIFVASPPAVIDQIGGNGSWSELAGLLPRRR
jgi:hypothetical protein